MNEKEIIEIHGLNTLVEANLREANLTGADLTEANLIGADLSEANLIRANLSGAWINGANLTGADLNEANLIGVNLNEANLSGANLNGSDLSGANLFNIKGINIFYIGGIGSEKRITYYIPKQNYICCGCFHGTMEEFEQKINETHKTDSLHRQQYERVVKYLKEQAELLGDGK